MLEVSLAWAQLVAALVVIGGVVWGGGVLWQGVKTMQQLLEKLELRIDRIDAECENRIHQVNRRVERHVENRDIHPDAIDLNRRLSNLETRRPA